MNTPLVPVAHLVQIEAPSGGANWRALQCSCGWRYAVNPRFESVDLQARIRSLEHQVLSMQGIVDKVDEDLELRLTLPRYAKDYFPWPFPPKAGDSRYPDWLKSQEWEKNRQKERFVNHMENCSFRNSVLCKDCEHTFKQYPEIYNQWREPIES